jgi:hypothetical protein
MDSRFCGNDKHGVILNLFQDNALRLLAILKQVQDDALESNYPARFTVFL